MQIPVKEWVTYIKVFTAEYVDIINIQAFLYTSVFLFNLFSYFYHLSYQQVNFPNNKN